MTVVVLVGCSLIKMSPVGSNEQYGDDLTACPPIIQWKAEFVISLIPDANAMILF